MALSRKPKHQASEPTNVEDFIRRGGAASAEQQSPETGAVDYANVRLRIPADVLAEVDRAVQGRRSGISRHTWIMEAVVEKLANEKK